MSRDLMRLAASVRPDVIHVHGIWGPGARAAFGLAKAQPKLKFVLSPHGMLEPWALRNSRMKKAIAWRVWGRELVAKAAVVHVLCVPEAATVEAVVPGKLTTIIPNGIDLPEVTGAERGRGEQVLLFLGRIHPKKGLAVLLDVWSKLGEARAGWRLVVAGWDDGGHEQTLKEQVKRLSLKDSVSFVGPVFGIEKDQLLRTASAFVLPSYSEGLPMAVLEAWAYGLPVLMTEACNLTEGFEAGAAVHVLPEPASLAEGLATLLKEMSPSARHDMGARGRSLVTTRFTWSRAAADMASLYESLASISN